MIPQGAVTPGTMKIRLFYPNPVLDFSTGRLITNPLDLISAEYEVLYLEVLDPIYHELCFIDTNKTRHRIIGLAYHVQETVPASNGLDASV